jgi:hypothetical protein
LSVVVAACAELQALRDQRVADAAWMNEAITKQEELTTLVSLLVDRLIGELWLQFARWCLLSMHFHPFPFPQRGPPR